MTTLIPTQRSPSAAFGGGIAALAIGGTCMSLAADPALSVVTRLVVGVVGGLLAAALGITAVRLARPRGGLVLDTKGQRLGIGLTGLDDIYWIPLDTLIGVGVRFRDSVYETTSYRTWSAELLCRDRPAVLLVEAPEREVVDHVVAMLTGEGGLPLAPDAEGDDDGEAPGVNTTTADAIPDASQLVHIGVRRRGALGDVFFLFGCSLSGVGLALFAQLATEPMVAVFIAPVVLLLGLLLLGIATTKRIAAEELEFRNNQLYHRWRIANFTWGEDQIQGPVRWRLRVQALKGAYLEALGRDGIISVGSGATTHSHVNVDGLNRLPQRLTIAACDPAPPAP